MERKEEKTNENVEINVTMFNAMRVSFISNTLHYTMLVVRVQDTKSAATTTQKKGAKSIFRNKEIHRMY